MIPKYKLIKDELDATKQKVIELTSELPKEMPHNQIIRKDYVNDDWAQYKTYTIMYECEYCGLLASHNEDNGKPKSNLYLILEKKYRQK